MHIRNKRAVNHSFLILCLAFSLASCSSAGKIKDLKESPYCQVWKDGTFGIKHAQIDSSEHAVTEGSCAFPCLFGPPKTFARFGGPQRNEIYLDSNSLISASDKVGGLQDSTLLLAHPTGLITFSPTPIAKEGATVKKQTAGFNSTTNYFFNSRCSVRQKALGITVLTYLNEN